MEKWLLRLVHLFDAFFKRQGIATDRLYTIVETKLLMDKRRVYMNWKQYAQKDNTNNLNMVLSVYLLLSIFAALAILFMPSYLLSLFFFHGYIILMMAMVLITDFSSVMLDTTDNQIILPKPVDSKTLFMARQVHILLYLLQFTVAMTIIPIICITFKFSILTGLAAVVTVLSSVLLSVFFTFFLYLLIIRLGSEKRVKDMIIWFQIALTVFFALAYQVIPRMINMNAMAPEFHLYWYSYFLPPTWMALSLDAVYKFNFDALHLLMIVLSVTVPIGLFWLIIRYLAPVFTTALSSMPSEYSSPKVKLANNNKGRAAGILSAFFARKSIIRAGFDLTWHITGRDKSFQLQFYPSLGYIFIFLFMFVFNSGNNMAEAWTNLSQSSKYLWFIYLPMFTVANGVIFVAFNENFAASWMYHSTPVKQPGEIILGAVISLFVKYFIPIYLLAFFFCLYVWGTGIIDDFVFGAANDYLCFLVLASLGRQYLPFSRQPNNRQQAGRFLLVMMQMMIVAILVGLHYLVIQKNFLLYIMLPVVILCCWLMEKRIAGTPWKKIAV